MKRLEALLSKVEGYQLVGSPEVEITGLAFDSREVTTGNLFFAWRGQKLDGHKYIEEAIKKGAVAVVTEKDYDKVLPVPHVSVSNVKETMGKVADEFYDHASSSLNLIGITGTNGKTSVTHMVQSIFKQDYKDMAMITTLGNYVNGTWYQTSNTTPESIHLHKLFYEMVTKGVNVCMMEVSSHALELYRVEGCSFDYGVFTNLSPDHLEFHHTMEAYYQAKRKLFFMTKKGNIINLDDEYGRRLNDDLSGLATPKLTYGLSHEADVYASDIDYSLSGSSFMVNVKGQAYGVTISMPGDIYVYNALAAFALGLSYGLSPELIARGLSDDIAIKGRFETVIDDEDYSIIIDFAHTEDSLEKALNTLRPLTKGRVLLVYGVYAPDYELGDTKRDGMAKVASECADLSFVTSDNPKFIDPQMIVDDISVRMSKYGGEHLVFVDRKEAIEAAIDNAEPGDLIVLAGKGHETYQYIGDEKVPFSERKIALSYISKKKMYG